jgi:ABC-2 type transport system ATP-binding protein
MDPVIELRGVSKRFQIRLNRSPSLKSKFVGLVNGRYRERRRELMALDGINLSVGAGEGVAILGPNGSGKSTLFKLIAGIMPPTSGVVRTRGLVAPMIELGVGFHPELTGLENIFLNTSFYGISRKQTESLVERIVEFSELGDFVASAIKNYSSGMVVRLAFAIAVNTAPDILLIDEILSVGDKQFQEKCRAQMHRFREEGRTFVLVSHSMGDVIDMCERALLLHHGRIVAEGPAAEIAELYLSGSWSSIAESLGAERTRSQVTGLSMGQEMAASECGDARPQ